MDGGSCKEQCGLLYDGLSLYGLPDAPVKRYLQSRVPRSLEIFNIRGTCVEVLESQRPCRLVCMK